MRVKKLRVDVISRLESGLIITDATQCAMELVENALDAKCTAVAVRINLKEFIIEVVDNGIGISPDDLNLVGERFMTSKCWNLDDVNNNMETYGYRGQAIASIIDVCSKLLINTKSELSSKTLVKVFTKGQSPSISVSSQEKCTTGTTITVYDFMCTMPVRRKRIKEIFDIQEIKNQLEYLALIHNEVSFTLRDENKGEIILQSQTRRNAGFSFADLFGMAVGKFLLPFLYREHKIEIEGFIALERHVENNLQFLYVNRRIISKSLTHKFVNNVIDRYLSERQTLTEKMSDIQVINMNIRKGSHNVYLIQIRCPYSEYEMFRSLKKTTVEFKNWDRILHCLKCAVKSVLKVQTGNNGNDTVIHKRKTENIKSFPRKGDMDLGQLKCGIRGGFVKRNQCQLVPPGEKTVSNHVNIIEKGTMNDEHQPSLTDEMKNYFSTRYELSKWLPYNFSERNDSVIKRETSPKCKMNELNEEKLDSDKETMETDFLIEFAVWLKSKMAHDCFIRKKYREFVTENVTVCKNVKKLIFEKRDREPRGKIEDSKTNCGKKRKFCNAAKELKRVKLSRPRRNFTEDNNNDNHNNDVKLTTKVKVKKSGKWKKERKSEAVDCLQSIGENASGRSVKNVKTGSGNELIELSSSFTNNINCIREKNKQFKGCIHSKKYFANGEPSRSWVSHENRATLEKKCNYSLAIDFWHERARTWKSKEMEKEEEGEKGENIDRRIKIMDKRNSKRLREIEVQTTITALNCDQITQMNAEVLNDKDNGNEVCTTRKTGECVPMNIPESGKSNAESDIVTEVNLENEKMSNYLNNAIEPPQVSNCKRIQDDFAIEDSNGNTSQNLPDTLSLVENAHIGDRKCPTPFTCTNRYTFIPKGLSPTVLDRSFSKFGSRHDEIGKRSIEAPDGTCEGNSSELFSKSLLPDEVVEELRENIVKNLIHYESEPMKSYLTKSEAKIHPLINSFAVDKHILSNVEVIGQWDNKFIIGKTCRMLPEEKQLLFVFDQHAVDERIRLEKLLKDSRNIEGNFISTNCLPPIRCKMDESMLRFIQSLETVLLNFGIKVSVVDSEHALFHQIPLCLVQDHVDNMEMILKNVVNEIVEEHNETRGSGSSIPRVLFTIISTRACKSAVKFNVSLSSDEMTKLIDNLVSCQTPFQCAHGRPTVVPLLNLAALRNQIKKMEEKLDFKKFRKL